MLLLEEVIAHARPKVLLPSPTPTAGWVPTNYTYTAAHPHAVTALTGGSTASYQYDANGNMTCRMEAGSWFIQTYNAENRLTSVTKLASGNCTSPGLYQAVWNFGYDGDGTRVSQIYTPYDTNGNAQTPVLTAYFMGGAYEVSGTNVKKYYAIAGMTIAMNDGNGMKYLLTDHLGSVVAITDSSGILINQQRYLPFGQVRTDVGSIAQTDFAYTGQRYLSDVGLMDYHARFYDQLLGRFIQPDTIVPNQSNPQTWNRYSYVSNNPIILTDPTGRSSCVGSHYDDGPGCAKKEGSQLNREVKQTKYQNECAAGTNKGCPGGAKAGIAIFVGGVITAGLLEYASLGGGLADLLETGFWRAGYACIQSAICRSITGMAGGATTTSVPARNLYYSQQGVSTSTTKEGIMLDDLSQDMAQGWRGEPLKVLNIDGQLVSLDNRRLVVAKMLDINVPVTISRGYTLSDLITEFDRDGIFSQIPIRGTDMIIDMFGKIGGN